MLSFFKLPNFNQALAIDFFKMFKSGLKVSELSNGPEEITKWWLASDEVGFSATQSVPFVGLVLMLAHEAASPFPTQEGSGLSEVSRHFYPAVQFDIVGASKKWRCCVDGGGLRSGAS